jgi:hypothetical protein
MDYRVQQFFESEINPGETVVWSAAPDPKRSWYKALPMVLFAIPWTAFAIFWMFGAMGFKAPDFSRSGGFMQLLFPLFGLPFVLVGLGMFASPFWLRRQAALTGYFITNQRAVLVEKRFFGGFRVRSFFPEDLSALDRTQREDGSGDIIISREFRRSRNGTAEVPVGFFGIPDARSVEAFLQRLASSKTKPS